MSHYKIKFRVTVITLSCGHKVDFLESPPKRGHFLTCRTCLKDGVVLSRRVEWREKWERNGGSVEEEVGYGHP